MEFLKDKEGKIHINITKASDSVTQTSDDIKRSWAYLHKTDPELSRELFMYSFYKLGFTFGPFSTMQVAPVEVKLDIKVGSFFNVNTMQEEEISYIEYLNKIQNGEININIEDFSRQYILNHLDNKVFVSTPKGMALRNIKELSKDEESNNKRSFFLPEAYWSSQFKLSKNKEKDSFVPFIKIEDFPGSGTYSIYMAWGEGPKFNKSIDAGITYIRVDALGESNLSLAYGPSMIADNNSPSFSQIEPSSTNPEVTPVIKEEEFDRGFFIEKIGRFGYQNRP